MCDSREDRKDKMRSTPLYALSAPDVSTFEAMKQVSEARKRVKRIGGDAVRPFVLAYTPDFCGFVDWREAEGDEDGKFLSLDGGKAIENIFELRCFCSALELRWVREGSENKGRAVLLSESLSESPLQGLEEKKDIKKDILALDGRYQLWGRGIERQGTVRLCDHRIGELPVPVAVKRGERVLLNVVEYFVPDEYGNLTFLVERLTGLQTATEAKILKLTASK